MDRGNPPRHLGGYGNGEPTKAADQLLPLAYEELRKLAAAKMAQEKPGQTFQATALVHEAWMRSAGALAHGAFSPHSSLHSVPRLD